MTQQNIHINEDNEEIVLQEKQQLTCDRCSYIVFESGFVSQYQLCPACHEGYLKRLS